MFSRRTGFHYPIYCGTEILVKSACFTFGQTRFYFLPLFICKNILFHINHRQNLEICHFVNTPRKNLRECPQNFPKYIFSDTEEKVPKEKIIERIKKNQRYFKKFLLILKLTNKNIWKVIP